jgi:tetratricopeptide (TPR) repeat protein
MLRYALFGLFACLFTVHEILPALAQTSARKPSLIRDTGVAEGKEDPEASKAKVYNPMEAERSVKIGEYYFKRKNYDAAIARYLEALEYQPNRIEAFEALGRAYEKKGDLAKALALYKDFVDKYPSSPKAADFQSRITRLEKKR